MNRPRHLVIGTPIKGEALDVYNDAVNTFACSLPPDSFKIDWLKYKSGLVKSRDTICAHALHVGADDVIMWDSDNTAAPAEVLRLLSHDVDIVGMPYTTKEHPARWVFSPLPGNPPPDQDGLMEVLECGTGMKRIRVSALREMCEANPQLEYDAAEGSLPKEAKRWNLHFMGVVNRRWLSEDYGFDYIARQCGLKVYVDTMSVSRHWGTVAYPLLPPPMPGLVKVIKGGSNTSLTKEPAEAIKPAR